MTTDSIRAAIQARPFKPFVIRTGDGSTYAVTHPELITQSQGGRTVVVFGPGDEELAILDLPSVTALEYRSSISAR